MIFDATELVMPVWRIRRVDPGFIYIIESNGRYKIGKTRRTKDRIQAAPLLSALARTKAA